MDLGNLYFDVLLRDKTNDEIKKIADKLSKLGNTQIKIDKVKVDKKAVRDSIQKALNGRAYSITLTTVKVNRKAIRDAIQTAINEAAARAGVPLPGGSGGAPNQPGSGMVSIRGAESAAGIATNNNLVSQAKQAALLGTNLHGLGQAYDFARAAALDHLSVMERLKMSMQGAQGIIGSLRNEILNFATVYTIQDVLKNVVNIGGELENQRIAMSAIMKDAGKGRTVFNKVQNLAVKSPFGVMQLNSYAKQLTAYSVPFNELYDTLNRLADVSAGVGVSMDRIILAYGQIKAKHVLAGTELRQLTEANIPIIDMLSEKYTKQLGRYVGASEIYKMISEKRVPFEDVKAAFKEMTDQGGQFYNMQESMSESLKSKWKNLGDAVDVLYGKMANGMLGNALKGVANILTDITYKYGALAGVLGGIVVARKTSLILLNRETGVIAKNTMAEIMRQKASIQSELGKRKFYGATDAEAADKANRAYQRSYLQLYQNAQMHGRLSEAQAKYLVMSKTATGQEVAALQSIFRWSDKTVHNLQSTPRAVANAYGNMIKISSGFVGALKSIFSWTNLIMVAISAVGAVIGNQVQKSAEMRESIKESADAARSAAKSLGDTYERVSAVNPKGMGTAEMKSEMEKMKDVLKDYFPSYTAEFFSKAFGTDAQGKVKSLTEQFKILAEQIRLAKEAAVWGPMITESIRRAFSETDHWYNSKDIKSEANSVLNGMDELSETAKGYLEAGTLPKYMDTLIQKHEQFAAALKKAGISAKDYKSQLVFLFTEYKDINESDFNRMRMALFNSSYRVEYNGLSGMSEKRSELVYNGDMLAARYEEMKQQAREYSLALAEEMRMRGVDLNHMTKAQEMEMVQGFENFMDELQITDEKIRKALISETLIKPYHIKIVTTFSGAENVESDLQRYLKKVFKGQFDAAINNGGTLTETHAQIQQGYKTSTEEAKLAYATLKKWVGRNVIWGKKYTPSGAVSGKLLDVVKSYNDALDKLDAVKAGGKALGWTFDDGQKKNNKEATQRENKRLASLKEEFSSLREAYDNYKQLRQKMSEEGALKEMRNSPFAAWFKNGGISEENYVKMLEDIKKRAKAIRKDTKPFQIEISKAEFNVRKEAIEEAAKAALSKMQKYIEDVSGRWDLFRSLFSKTNDINFAKEAFSSDNIMWDAASGEMAEKLSKAIGGKKIDWNMDSETAKKFFSNSETNLALFEKINTRIHENWKSWLNDVADAKSTLMDTNAKIEQHRQKIAETEDKRNAGIVSEGDAAAVIEKEKRAIAELEQELWKLSPLYEKLFGDTTYKGTKTLEKFIEIIDKLRHNAKAVYGKDGQITGYSTSYDGKEYKMNASDFRGLTNLREKIVKQLDTNPIRKFREAWSTLFGKNKSDDPDERREAIKKLAGSLVEMLDAASSAATSLGDIFSASGNEKLGQTMKDISTVASGIKGVVNSFASGNPIAIVTSSLELTAKLFTMVSSRKQKALENDIKTNEALINVYQNFINTLNKESEKYLGNIYSRHAPAGGGITANERKRNIGEMREYAENLYKYYRKNGQYEWSSKAVEDLQKELEWYDKLGGVSEGEKKRLADIATERADIAKSVALLQTQLDLWNASDKEKLSIRERIKELQERSVELGNEERSIQEAQNGQISTMEYNLALLVAERDRVYKNMKDEAKKAGTSQETLDRYAQKIEELNQEIDTLEETTANSLYGIDLKGWSDSLAEALTSAWIEGKDAMESYNDSLGNILKSVLNKWVSVEYVQSRLSDIKDFLFGEDGKGGAMKDGMLDENELMTLAGKLSDLKDGMGTAQNVVTQLSDAFEKLGVNIGEGSTSLSKSISGITENTADLLASYLNAVRADVSVMRADVRKIIEDAGIGGIGVIARQQLSELQEINTNTRLNAKYCEEVRDMMRQNIVTGKGFKLA